MYFGGMVKEYGRSEVDVRRRIQAGVDAGRKVEGVFAGRKIVHILKRRVLRACV